MLRFPAAFGVERFLAEHWQKAPLLLPSAIPRGLPSLSADELAWLAMQEDVESRLVTTERDAAGERYAVRHGPFSESELCALPARDWSLLVHDVDKHLPDFRDWFGIVPFIPDWRIDDLMVSCAAPGGSVGPHRDHYDVFLCQGDGGRQWHLNVQHDLPAAANVGELSLLQAFVDPNPSTVRAGDVLYLPPGVAHWGVASELCVTYSIGMRAPTVRDLCCALDRPALAEPQPAERYYTDPDLSADEARAGCISMQAVARAQTLLAANVELDAGQTARLLVAVATDPKAWLAPATDDAAAARARLKAGERLAVHGMTRLAWCTSGGVSVAGANGFVRPIRDDEVHDMLQLCTTRVAPRAQFADPALLDWLIDCGTFAVDAGP